VIDAPDFAEAVDREFYGKKVPHKFKVGISGCSNNCLKAEENDIGIKGWVEPRWTGGGCTYCGICETVCPTKVIRVSESDRDVSITLQSCIGCGDCVASCPTGAMTEGSRGFRLFAGGKFGRVPFLGKKILRDLRTKEEAIAAIGAALEFFRAHGKPKERFGDTVLREGFPVLETSIQERLGQGV